MQVRLHRHQEFTGTSNVGKACAFLQRPSHKFTSLRDVAFITVNKGSASSSLNNYTLGNRQRYRCWPGNVRWGV
eukprot:5696606-Pleurochrysis_carterae.AAC.1